MKEIPLTQGQVALVDDSDYKELSKFKWYATRDPHNRCFYAIRNIYLSSGKQTKEYMHRRILGLTRGDGRHVDHLDHDTLDNRQLNIRIVTRSENMHNMRCKGYTWHKGKGKYLARIGANGVRSYLGYFGTPDEARAAYLAAKAELHPTAPAALLLG